MELADRIEVVSAVHFCTGGGLGRRLSTEGNLEKMLGRGGSVDNATRFCKSTLWNLDVRMGKQRFLIHFILEFVLGARL